VVDEWPGLVAPADCCESRSLSCRPPAIKVQVSDTEDMEFAIDQISFGGEVNLWDFHHVGVMPRTPSRWMTDLVPGLVNVCRGSDHGGLLAEGRPP
jgi:hypothetical protein